MPKLTATRAVMPIMGCATIKSIPWGAIASHERQAQHNHGQSLDRLAGRGGLSTCEAVAIIEDRRWQRMAKDVSERRLIELCDAWRGLAQSDTGDV